MRCVDRYQSRCKWVGVKGSILCRRPPLNFKQIFTICLSVLTYAPPISQNIGFPLKSFPYGKNWCVCVCVGGWVNRGIDVTVRWKV